MQVRDEEKDATTELPEIKETKEELLKNTKKSEAEAEQSLINIANTQPEKVIGQYMVD